MKEVNQEQLLDSLENRVEQHIAEAVKVFQNLSNEALLQAAPDGGWSIAQCLAHLNTYGNYYLPRLKKGLAESKAVTANATVKSTWLGKKFIRMMDPDNSPTKYKAAKKHLPPADLDALGIAGEFIRQQEELLSCLRLARKSDLNTVKIPTSIFRLVRLNLGDVLQFLIVHNERHIRQAGRILPSLHPASSQTY